jgi:dihydroflavonol-4-reductase
MTSLKGKTIAVTGATGFVGRYVVDALLQRGAHVVGVVRNPDRVPELRAKGVELRRADLRQPKALQAGFVGADAVVSNAALFAVNKMISFDRELWREHDRTNVEGTTNVMRAAAAAQVHRVVHVSSVAVYRNTFARHGNEDIAQLDDSSWRTPFNAYQVSKALSEQAAWRLAQELGLQLTTVRPCTIYGAFDPNFTPILKRWFGMAWCPFPTTLRLPVVYAGDVAEAIALAIEHPEASVGKAYNTTGDDFDIGELANAWVAAGGIIKALRLPLPLPAVQSFDHSRATKDLGWKNRPYVDALRETFALERAAV